MLSFVVLVAILAIIVIGVEIVARSTRLPLELTRKCTHIVVGTLVGLSTAVVDREYLVALAIMFLVVIVLSRQKGIFRSIHDSNRSGIGEYWYPVGILAAVLLFPKPEAEAYAILVLAICDGLAGLFGKLLGRTKIPYISAPKTYLGTSVFMLSAFIVSLFFLPVPIAAGAAVLLGAIELIGFKGIDNILLPISAGGIAMIFGLN